MRASLLLAAAVISTVAASPAAALKFDFDLTGSRSASFRLDTVPGPDSFTAFQSFFDDVEGIYGPGNTPGTADISFGSFPFGPPGGFEAINLTLLGFSQFSSSQVLFTGTTAAPVFKTGSFALTSIVSGASTLTITAVPEPATWALLVTGFGLVGGAVRRRRRTVAA